MRHRVEGRKLGMKSPHRKAMFANMAASLVLNDKIETTLPRAKELRKVADRLITLGKSQTLHARRRAVMMIRDKKAVHKLFSELAERFAGRNGGYTRILKLGWRHGDAAPMAAIEYLASERGPDAADEKKHADGKKHKAQKKAAKVEKHAAPRPVKKMHAQTPARGKPATRQVARARKAPTGD